MGACFSFQLVKNIQQCILCLYFSYAFVNDVLGHVLFVNILSVFWSNIVQLFPSYHLLSDISCHQRLCDLLSVKVGWPYFIFFHVTLFLLIHSGSCLSRMSVISLKTSKITKWEANGSYTIGKKNEGRVEKVNLYGTKVNQQSWRTKKTRRNKLLPRSGFVCTHTYCYIFIRKMSCHLAWKSMLCSHSDITGWQLWVSSVGL